MLTGLIHGNEMTPDRSEVSDVEGSHITLSCNYTYLGTTTLQWYQQHPNSSPLHLLTFAFAGQNQTAGRLSGRMTKNNVSLTLSSAELSDTAL